MKLDFAKIPKVCISLKRSTERRELVQKQFKKAGIRVEFVDAIDRNDLILPELSDKENPKSVIPIGTGILACMLSHKKVMEEAIAANIPAVCIFEDDIVLSDDFNERIKYMEGLPGFDFDILSLGGHFPGIRSLTGSANPTEMNHIYQITELSGTYGYIITKKAMEFCVRNLHYNFGIDQFMATHLYRRFKSMAFLPFPVGTRPCKSEIVGVMCAYENTRWFYQQESIKDLEKKYNGAMDEEQEKKRIATAATDADRARSEMLAKGY